MKKFVSIYKPLLILLYLPLLSTGTIAQEQLFSTNVETLQLVSRRLEIHNTYVGHLKPLERVMISSESEGIIEKTLFEVGDSVEKGQLLANVETKLLSRQEALAQENYKQSVKDYKTERTLFKRKVSTSSKVDSMKTKRDLYKIQLEIAQINLNKSQIKSPIKGVIKQKNAQVGEFVQKGKTLLEVMDISQVLVSFNVPEKEIQYVKVGKKVNVRIDAFPGMVFSGKIHTRGLEADLKNRSFPVEVLLENPQQELLPGMMARAKMETLVESNKIIIPRYAVLERENSRIVYIAKNGAAVERPVVLGTIIRDEVQILSGLQSRDRLIVTGHHFLTHKEKINVVNNTKQRK